MYMHMTCHGKTRVKASWWGWAGSSAVAAVKMNVKVQKQDNKRCSGNEVHTVRTAEHRAGLLF